MTKLRVGLWVGRIVGDYKRWSVTRFIVRIGVQASWTPGSSTGMSYAKLKRIIELTKLF
jgi:hypothetical protein